MPYTSFVAISLGKIPFQLDVGIVPGVDGHGDVLDFIIRLAEKIQIPLLVHTVRIRIFLFQMCMKCRKAMLAAAARAMMIDFIIDLPADDVLILAKFLRHLFGDAVLTMVAKEIKKLFRSQDICRQQAENL